MKLVYIGVRPTLHRCPPYNAPGVADKMQVFKNDTKDAIELTGAENLKSINRWVQKGVKEGVR